MKSPIRVVILVLAALVQTATAQPRLAPTLKDLPRAKASDAPWARSSCDFNALGLAARDLIGPHDDPTPADQPPCVGRVCDAWTAMVEAQAAARKASREYARWRALDAATAACGY